MQSTIVINSGCPVFSSDGEQLGDVAEVRGRWFEVRAGDEAGSWLAMRDVATASDERITLDFRAENLARHQVPAPPADGDTGDSHMATGDRLDGHHAAGAGSSAAAIERKN